MAQVSIFEQQGEKYDVYFGLLTIQYTHVHKQWQTPTAFKQPPPLPPLPPPPPPEMYIYYMYCMGKEQCSLKNVFLFYYFYNIGMNREQYGWIKWGLPRIPK